MKNAAIASVLAGLLVGVSTAKARDVGMGVLMLWPTARSTALAGAMTGFADEADATYFNPAGLAFQATAKADVTHSNWLPGLYPGMYYESAAGGTPVRLPFLHGRNAFVAGSVAYMTIGETDIVNERGDFLGRFCVWRACAALHSGFQLSPKVGFGISAKLLHSEHELDYWILDSYSYGSTELGLEKGGTATSTAFDAGLCCRPLPQVSVGLTIANMGPDVSYHADGWQGPYEYPAPVPHMARLGLCWTPIASPNLRLRVTSELTKVLVSMFLDTTGQSLGRQLNEEWRDVWKAVGVEATASNFLSFRLGYIEDLTGQRGGVVLQDEDGITQHYGVWDALTRKNLGRLERIGLCWGVGLGNDRLRFDLSSDAAIYDFPTSNWKFQLTCNDLGRLF